MSVMLFEKQDSSAEKFWQDRELELGTPVLAKVLGQVIREDNRRPLWGLFYTTEFAVYFQTFQSNNWLSTVFAGGRGGGESEDEIIEIPKESIVRFESVHGKKSKRKLFRQPPAVILIWKDPVSGNQRELIFEMDGDTEAFIASLPR